MEIFETLKECHNYWHTYDTWNNAKQEMYAKKKYLFDSYKKNHPDEYNKLKLKSKTVIRTINILDNASENAAENMQLATETVSNTILTLPALLICGLSMFGAIKAGKYYDTHKKMPLYFYISAFYPGVFVGLTDLPFVFWRTKKQIEASRVARAKSKETELKDERNFVIYTKEQIEQAEKTLQNMPAKISKDEDEKNISLKNAFLATLNLDKEYSAYLEKYNQNSGIDKNFQNKLNKNYSAEKLLQANKDKEIILNTIKEINNNAEKYCENAEAAFATLKLLNFLAILPSAFIVNKIANLIFPKSNGLIKKMTALYIPLLVTFPINIWANKKQKEAAKVGRFKMKQKLSEDLSPLAYFDNMELKKADNIKYKPQKLNIFQKAIRNLHFIPEYLKEREEYLNYKKTQWNEEEKLNHALKNIKISEEQKKDAQDMQKKIFFVFDELDEMSQKYSENMEGTINLSKKILGIIKTFVFMTALALPVYTFFSGNFYVTKICKIVSSIIFSKNSKLKKNIDEICEIAEKDKTIKAKIDNSLSFVNNKAQDLLKEPKITKQLQNIFNIISEATKNESTRKNFSNTEFKNGHIAKWLRNFACDIVQLVLQRVQKIPDTKLNKINDKNTVQFLQKLKTTNIKISNMNTLKFTGLLLAVPCILITLTSSYFLNTFLAYLQKKAGFIGVMKAIDKLDNPKYFTREKTKPEKNEYKEKQQLLAKQLFNLNNQIKYCKI